MVRWYRRGLAHQDGTVSWKLKMFFDEDMGPAWGHVDGQIGGAFSSTGGLGNGAELTCQTITNILINCRQDPMIFNHSVLFEAVFRHVPVAAFPASGGEANTSCPDRQTRR